MIPVARSTKPHILKKSADRWLSNLKILLSNPKATQTEIRKAQNKYRHGSIKSALIKMFHGKCAYCESKFDVVTYGAIEHFFPKSKHPELTFEWSNLLLSCDRCNDIGHKGANFPLDSDGNPLLIDPTAALINPNIHLRFSWDAVAGLASIYGRDERGNAVEKIFDLNGMNGRQELVAHRSQYVKRLCALLRLAQLGDQEAIALCHEACNSSSEYSAFALTHIRPYLFCDE